MNPGTVSNIAGRKRIEELRVIKERLEYLLTWSPVIVYTCEPYDDYAVTFVKVPRSMRVSSLTNAQSRTAIDMAKPDPTGT